MNPQNNSTNSNSPVGSETPHDPRMQYLYAAHMARLYGHPGVVSPYACAPMGSNTQQQATPPRARWSQAPPTPASSQGPSTPSSNRSYGSRRQHQEYQTPMTPPTPTPAPRRQTQQTLVAQSKQSQYNAFKSSTDNASPRVRRPGPGKDAVVIDLVDGPVDQSQLGEPFKGTKEPSAGSNQPKATRTFGDDTNPIRVRSAPMNPSTPENGRPTNRPEGMKPAANSAKPINANMFRTNGISEGGTESIRAKSTPATPSTPKRGRPVNRAGAMRPMAQNNKPAVQTTNTTREPESGPRDDNTKRNDGYLRA